MRKLPELLQYASDCAKEFDKIFEVNQTMRTRLALFEEEANELESAINWVDKFDAMADMLYVAGGILNHSKPSDAATCHVFSMLFSDVFWEANMPRYTGFLQLDKHCLVLKECLEEVHRSNLTKLEDGKPLKIEDRTHPKYGKILKGKNYTPPNLLPIIKKYLEF